LHLTVAQDVEKENNSPLVEVDINDVLDKQREEQVCPQHSPHNPLPPIPQTMAAFEVHLLHIGWP
jgi:hypothetical protein